MGGDFALCLASFPLSYIQVAIISSLSPTLVSCQTPPNTQPPGQGSDRKSYLSQYEVARLSARAVTLSTGTQGNVM